MRDSSVYTGITGLKTPGPNVGAGVGGGGLMTTQYSSSTLSVLIALLLRLLLDDDDDDGDCCLDEVAFGFGYGIQ